MRGSTLACVAPASVDELREALARFDRDGLAVSIEGGNTLRGFGNALARHDATIALTQLRGVLTHEYHDLTCAVAAGTTLHDLREVLAQHGQFVPLDAPLPALATVGGTIAAGWPGPRRHAFGRARDFAIGSHAVLADGTFAAAGGMVVKNVTGYDMTKLYAGSFGTLAVLTRLNFKTLPVPAAQRALIARLPEKTSERAARAIGGLTVAPSAAFFARGFAPDGDGAEGRVFVLLEGSAALIDRATRDTRSALGRAGVPETTIVNDGAWTAYQTLLDYTIEAIGERSITFRSMGTPSTGYERALGLHDAAQEQGLFSDVLLDLMNGDAFVRTSQRDRHLFAERAPAFHAAARMIDPSCAIIAGDAPVRATFDAWGEAPPAIERMRALKARFDPNGTLNPGRFLAGI